MTIKTIGLMMILLLRMLTTPFHVDAQESGKVYRIGFLGSDSSRQRGLIPRFLEQFRELGWIEGQHFVMEYQTAPRAQLDDRANALAAELVRRKVDIIITSWQVSNRAAKEATTTIPIVSSGLAYPVESGLIESIARPGGNLTGLIIGDGVEVAGKRQQLLMEAVPVITRMAILYGQWDIERVMKAQEDGWESTNKQLGITTLIERVATTNELEDAFARIVQFQPDAMFVVQTKLISLNAKRIMAFANKHQLPVSTNNKRVLRAGGLLYYRSNRIARHRRIAFFVDKILKKTNPADLPAEFPTKFDLIVNLKAAKQLGITIPPTVLFQATEVIQ